MIKLGDKVRDKVSGLVGIAYCRAEYLNGCVRIGIQGPQKSGVAPEGQHFDVEQLEVIKSPGVELKSKPKGGPEPAPRRQPDPVR